MGKNYVFKGEYAKAREYYKRNDVKSNVFSSGLLGLVNPIYEIQLSAEYEQLFVNSSFGDFNIILSIF